MNGSNTMARTNDLKGMCLLSSNASHSPRTNLMTLATTVYTKVLNTDSVNTLSVTRNS